MTIWNIQLSTSDSSKQVKEYQPLPEPYGWSSQQTVSHIQSFKRKEMIQSKLFQISTANKSQIFMMFFMFWMLGNTISIIMLLTIVQSLFSCISGLLKVNQIFQPYQSLQVGLNKYKFIYLVVNLISLGIILYKLSMLGLLPISPIDYIDLIPPYYGHSVIVPI